MILQSLVRYYEVLSQQNKVARQGWCSARVSYGIQLNADGMCMGIVFLKSEVERGKKKDWIPQVLQVPEMVARSSGVSANYLCDNSKYLLGIDKEGTGGRIQECFEAAKQRHLNCLQNVHSDMAEAVKRFFESWKPDRAREYPDIAQQWEDITAGGNLIFMLGADYAQDDLEIRQAWEKQQTSATGNETGMCLVTGKQSEIARIHTAIKGVQGAQSSGAALVSFNAPAFESYGKEQSYNAPVGKYAAFAYTTALNYLLSQGDYVFRLGDTTVVFWAEEGNELYQDVFSLCIEPEADNQEVIRGIFEALKKNQAVSVKDTEEAIDWNQKFYILGIAPNAARLSVRFFYENNFGAILKNLEAHYNRMDIVKPVWDKITNLGVERMLQETVNQKSSDKKPKPNMASAVLQSILSGGRYPESLYSNTLIRIRAEQGNISRGKAAIVKAYLIRNCELEKEGVFVGLNEVTNDAAYVLGRCFAVMEAIQEEANPGINTTIKDRYFNSACATPAMIFPVLLKLKNSHIRKIGKEGSKIYYEKLLTELLGRLETYPRRLSLEEQGRFILGYYHQVQKRYEKKEDN